MSESYVLLASRLTRSYTLSHVLWSCGDCGPPTASLERAHCTVGVLAGTHWGDDIQAERQPLCGCVGGWCSLLCLSRLLRVIRHCLGHFKKNFFSFSFSVGFQYLFLLFTLVLLLSLCFFLFFQCFPFFRAMGLDSGKTVSTPVVREPEPIGTHDYFSTGTARLSLDQYACDGKPPRKLRVKCRVHPKEDNCC